MYERIWKRSDNRNGMNVWMEHFRFSCAIVEIFLPSNFIEPYFLFEQMLTSTSLFKYKHFYGISMYITSSIASILSAHIYVVVEMLMENSAEWKDNIGSIFLLLIVQLEFYFFNMVHVIIISNSATNVNLQTIKLMKNIGKLTNFSMLKKWLGKML